MAYQICINKSSPCCVVPWTVVCTPSITPAPAVRVIEVFGCTPDLTQGERSNYCCQGLTQPTGSSCQWTVPTGQTSVVVELWGGGGGGGSGGNATCCGNQPGAGAGTYVKKTLTVSAGQVLTICAGAGGCFGTANDSQAANYCCCGFPGSCSFVKIGATICADAQGGSYGASQCYISCGCYWVPNGNTFYVSGGPCGANGSWGGCAGYGYDILGTTTENPLPGCGTNGFSQHPSMGGGTTFGGDQSFWGGNYGCYNYLKWNSACTNTAGIAGPGGDPVSPTSSTSAYNTPGSANYTCGSGHAGGCTRWNAAVPGNFPGGGGASGSTPCCCQQDTAGGNGAPGYVRLWW